MEVELKGLITVVSKIAEFTRVIGDQILSRKIEHIQQETFRLFYRVAYE